jgi:hypothetical protein
MMLRLSSVIAAGWLAFGAAPAGAYCIFNKVAQVDGDSGLVGEVIRGGAWSAEIDRNGEACCDWKDRRCNPTGTREAKLVFGIRSVQTGRDAPQACVVEGEAGGWIYVTAEYVRGTSGRVPRLKCTAFRYRR